MDTEGLIRIGDMSKLFGVSIDTLRHYDRIGLLRPITDPENNYRYYSPEQIVSLKMILLGKQSGIPLAKIRKTFEQEEISAYRDMMKDMAVSIDSALKSLQEQYEYVMHMAELLTQISDFKNDYAFKNLKSINIDINIYQIPRDEMKNITIYPTTVEESENIEQWLIYQYGQTISGSPEANTIIYYSYPPIPSLRKFEDVMKEQVSAGIATCHHFFGRFYETHYWGTQAELQHYMETIFDKFGFSKNTPIPIHYAYSLLMRNEESKHFVDILFPVNPGTVL